MGGHHKHLGDIVRIDDADLAGIQAHIGGIDDQQALGAQLANGDDIVFRRAAAVNHHPFADGISRAHLRQQRTCAVVAHHAIADTE